MENVVYSCGAGLQYMSGSAQAGKAEWTLCGVTMAKWNDSVKVLLNEFFPKPDEVGLDGTHLVDSNWLQFD